MLTALTLLLACTHSATASDEPDADRAGRSEHAEHAATRPGEKPPPLCESGANIASALRRAVDEGEDRVQVVITLTKGEPIPELLQEPLAAGPLVQGWIDTDKLCELATTEGVENIRAPIEARAK